MRAVRFPPGLRAQPLFAVTELLLEVALMAHQIKVMEKSGSKFSPGKLGVIWEMFSSTFILVLLHSWSHCACRSQANRKSV